MDDVTEHDDTPTAADSVETGPRRRGRARRRSFMRARVVPYSPLARRLFERRPLLFRLMSWSATAPEPLVRLVAGRERVRVGGRVLNRRIQFILALTARIGGPLASGVSSQNLSGGSSGELGTRGSESAEGSEPASEPDPDVLRRQLRRFAIPSMPVRTDVHAFDLDSAAASGRAIPVRVYRPFGSGPVRSRQRGAPAAIVYFHGGGWVVGDLDTHDRSCRLLAGTTRCVVVSVDYRRAPEHPYPAAVEDAIASYRWVHDHVDELGAAPGQVAVMGDSAGGNLAAVVALLARDSDDVPDPIVQGLVYPVVDARLQTRSIDDLGQGFMLTSDTMRFYRDAYVPEPGDWERPDVSPLLAADHAGLPPALIVTAGFDPLLDDGRAYADALARAGCEVHYRCYDDLVHGFFGMGVVPESMAAAIEVCQSMGLLIRMVRKRADRPA